MYNNQCGHFRLICIISKQHLGMQSVREMEQVAHKQADLLGRAALYASRGSASQKPPRSLPAWDIQYTPSQLMGEREQKEQWELIQYSTCPTANLTVQVIPNNLFLQTGLSRESL